MLDLNTTYCDLENFHRGYRSVHGYLSLLVCVFGSIANILNIFVLTTKEMRISTNFILTGLAFADLLVMLEYMPYSSHVYLNPGALRDADYFSRPWTFYMYFHAIFTQVCHFISCCLTIILAIWRYIAITKPQHNNAWCNPRRTKIAIVLVYILCPFVCTPLVLGLNISQQDRSVYPNQTLIMRVDEPNYNGTKETVQIYLLNFDSSYEGLNLWLYGIVIKLLPCILLTVLSACLIKALMDAKKRWKGLSNSSGVPLVNLDSKKQRNAEKEQQVDRTTRMLLAILFLFLLTEFPQAILGLLSGIIGSSFYLSCYGPLGDIMDIFALTNSAINFILYCSMSQQFRTSFSKVFLPKDLFRGKKPDGHLLEKSNATKEISHL